jgi:hypothetical protein
MRVACYRTLDAVYLVFDTRYWILDAGCRILGTGYWVLGTGYWSVIDIFEKRASQAIMSIKDMKCFLD